MSKINGWLTSNISPLLAVIAVVAIFILFYLVMFSGVAFDQSTRDLAMYILGTLSSTLVTIYGYFFGSSAGSKAKQDQLFKEDDKETTN